MYWFGGYIPPSTPTPTPTPAPAPAATWTNPPDWIPQSNDHVKIHIAGDGWRYSSIDVFEGDLGTLGHEHERGGWIVLFDKPRGKYTGLFFPIAQLEYMT